MTTDLTRSTAADLADLLATGGVSAREVAQAHLDRTAAVDGDGALLPPRRRRGRARPGRRRRPPPGRGRGAARARRGADRGQGRHDDPRPADDVRLEDPAGLGAALRRDPRDAPARGRDADPRQDEHGRVRDGLLHRAQRLRPEPQPVGPRPDPRRLRRRVLLGRRVLPGARSRSAPTPAARSASPRPSRARWAPSRPTAGCRATASWRSRPRSTRPARARAPCSTPPSSTRSSPGTTRWTPRRSTPPSRRSSRPPAARTSPGCGSASSAS